MGPDGTAGAGAASSTNQILEIWRNFANEINEELKKTNLGAGDFEPGGEWDLAWGPALSRPSNLSSADIADAVEQLLQERTQVNQNVAEGNIADNKLKIAQQREVREEKKEEIATAQKEAADKAAKAGVFNKVFGWIMAVATLIAGIAMIASGAGAAAGAMMIAAAAVQIAQLSVEQAVDDGNLKMSDKDREVFGYAMMGISIALGVGAGIAAGAGSAIKGAFQAVKEAVPKVMARIADEGLAAVMQSAAKSAAASIAKAGSSAVDDFAQALKELPKAVKDAGKSFLEAAKNPVDTIVDAAKTTAGGIKDNPAKAAMIAAETTDAVAGGSNAIVQGKLGGETAAAKKRAAEAAADAQEAQSILRQLMLVNDDLVDQLKEVLRQYMDGANDAMNILKSDDETGVNARPIMT